MPANAQDLLPEGAFDLVQGGALAGGLLHDGLGNSGAPVPP
jgi:hypothetical protein